MFILEIARRLSVYLYVYFEEAALWYGVIFISVIYKPRTRFYVSSVRKFLLYSMVRFLKSLLKLTVESKLSHKFFFHKSYFWNNWKLSSKCLTIFLSGKLNFKYTGCYTNVTEALILEKNIPWKGLYLHWFIGICARFIDIAA
jgi:hypothetical protein